MISVLIAADSAVVRAGLESLVRASPVLSVAGTCEDLARIAARFEELQPDAVLLEMAGDVGPTLRSLGVQRGVPAVVLLIDDSAMNYVRAGVRGVLPRSATANEIVSAIEAAAAGLIVFHPETFEQTDTPNVPSEQRLTGREVEVLRLLSEGHANKEIAWRLGISEHTVKFHVASLFQKLHASSRTEAVTLGVRQGLILL